MQNLFESIGQSDFFRAQNNFSLLSLLHPEYKEQFGQMHRDKLSGESLGFFDIYFSRIGYWI
jgi:hypothetical protein